MDENCSDTDPKLKGGDLPLNDQGGVDGCLLASFGFFLFLIGVGLFFLGIYIQSVLLAILAFLLGTFIAGFFILYPVVRLLFFGRDNVLAALITTYIEGVITAKVVKNARKKRK